MQDDGSLAIRLRLPDALGMGKYLFLKNIAFSYGHETLIGALRENSTRSALQKAKNDLFSERGAAISYRFIRDSKGWRIFASVQVPPPVYTTQASLGYIGIDLNVDHLAIVETNAHGNLDSYETVSLNLYGKSSNQARAMIGEVAKTLVNKALRLKKPIVLEKLDFTAKKRSLKEIQPAKARILSSFAYQCTLEAIKARAYRFGVQVLEVNPAYTSLIGKLKFAKRYGLSVHHAAAFCIARRVREFSETLPAHADIPDGKGAYVAFVVPVRNQQRSNWAYLGMVLREVRAALAEHFRVTKCQSVVNLTQRDAMPSGIVGEIPARESLAKLLGQRSMR